MASGKFAFEKALRGRKDLTHTQFRLLIVLAGYADADLWNAHPGTKRLAEDACISVMTARRQLQVLEKAGWISVVGSHHSGHGRHGAAKVYALHAPDDQRDQVITQENSWSADQVFTQMNTGSSRSSDHPDEQLVGDDQVFKSDDQVFISDDQVFTQMNTHHVYTPDQYTRSLAPDESPSSELVTADQRVDDEEDPDGKSDKPSGSSPDTEAGLLPITGDEDPVELRMKQLRNKGHSPAAAIRILLAEQRSSGDPRAARRAELRSGMP